MLGGPTYAGGDDDAEDAYEEGLRAGGQGGVPTGLRVDTGGDVEELDELVRVFPWNPNPEAVQAVMIRRFGDIWLAPDGELVTMALVLGSSEEHAMMPDGEPPNMIRLAPAYEEGDEGKTRLDVGRFRDLYRADGFRVQVPGPDEGRKVVFKSKAHRITFDELRRNQALWQLLLSGTRLKPSDWVFILKQCDRSGTAGESLADTSPPGLVDAIETRVAARQPQRTVDVLSPRAMEASDDEEAKRSATLRTLRAAAADLTDITNLVGQPLCATTLSEELYAVGVMAHETQDCLRNLTGVGEDASLPDAIVDLKERLRQVLEAHSHIGVLTKQTEDALAAARAQGRGGVTQSTFNGALNRMITYVNGVKQGMDVLATSVDEIRLDLTRVESLASAGPVTGSNTTATSVLALTRRIETIELQARDGRPITTGLPLATLTATRAWVTTGALPIDKSVFSVFIDICSLLASLPGNVVDLNEMQAQEVHSAKVKRSPYESRHASSFVAAIPEALAASKTATTGLAVNPFRMPTYLDFDAGDGIGGVKNELEQKLDTHHQEMTQRIDDCLLNFPAAHGLAVKLLTLTHSFVTSFLTAIQSLYNNTLFRMTKGRAPTAGHKKQVWQLCIELFKTMFKALFRARLCGKDAHKLPVVEANSRMLFAALLAHKVMEDFKNARYTGHPDFTNTLNEFISTHAAQAVDVDLLREAQRSSDAEVAKMRATMKLMEQRLSRLDNETFNGARKGKGKKGAKAEEEE